MQTFILGVLLGVASLLPATFSGTYKGTLDGTEFKLTLTQEGSKVTGKAEAGPIAATLSGTVTGEQAEGDLEIAGDKLRFRATLTADGLQLKIAEIDEGKVLWDEADKIDFKRVGEAPAEVPKKAGVLAKYSKEPTEVLKSGKEYTHGSGGKMRYPASWTLQETEQGIRLTPPGAGENEFYIVMGEKAEGATDPADPAVVNYLDESLKTSLPDMKRVGKIEKATAGSGKGAFITWEGTALGKPSQTRAYVTILKGYGLALVAIAPKDVLDKQDKTLREIFYTFGWGQGKKDERLVGKWSHWSYVASAGRETKSHATLNADGTFSYSSESETNNNFQGKNQYGDITWTGGLSGRGGSGWSGTWTAFDGELTFNFQDGNSEVFNYEFKQEGANTFLVVWGDDKKKATEWSRAN